MAKILKAPEDLQNDQSGSVAAFRGSNPQLDGRILGLIIDT
jgi:hypothetical protein